MSFKQNTLQRSVGHRKMKEKCHHHLNYFINFSTQKIEQQNRRMESKLHSDERQT